MRVRNKPVFIGAIPDCIGSVSDPFGAFTDPFGAIPDPYKTKVERIRGAASNYWRYSMRLSKGSGTLLKNRRAAFRTIFRRVWNTAKTDSVLDYPYVRINAFNAVVDCDD